MRQTHIHPTGAKHNAFLVYSLGMTAGARRELFFATFSILALELAVIRWVAQQVTVFAYLGNVLLIGAFLGMGLGVAIGRRRASLFHITLPALSALVAVLAFSDSLHIDHTRLPGSAIAMWGMEGAKNFAGSMAIIVALFAWVVVVFLLAGTKVGELFAGAEALDAYGVDLAGSLAGVIAMTVASASSMPPPVWFAVGVIPLAWLSRRWTSWLAAAGVIFFAFLSIRGAFFSPYYRIDIDRAMDVTGAPIRLSVNRDFHQYIHNFSRTRLFDPSVPPELRKRLRIAESAYRLPFFLAPRHQSALIVGAGTGNDAAAALRQKYQRVVAVEIDSRIFDIGRALHPEEPYSDPRVVPVINDARAYFEQRDEQFDAVVFGLLDSHAAFSAMSSLRLENYIYTVEALRSAWAHVRSPGLMSISFATGGNQEWLSDRLYEIEKEATGMEPLIVPHPIQNGRFYIVGKGFDVRAAAARLGLRALPPSHRSIRPSTDDWPFLYRNPGQFPAGYIAIVAAILLLGLAGTRAAYGAEMFRRGSFDPLLFVMGAGFLLVETRNVTDLSLLFGSTWIVNAAVFAGVLAVVFVANAYVRRRGEANVPIFFVLLFASLLLNYFVRPDRLLTLSLMGRSIAGPLLAALPVGFAGIIFSSVFARSREPNASLGSNLLGAVVGGCFEFVSMATGLRALTLIALAFYAVAMLLYLSQSTRASSGSAASSYEAS